MGFVCAGSGGGRILGVGLLPRSATATFPFHPQGHRQVTGVGLLSGGPGEGGGPDGTQEQAREGGSCL